jgi:hypothetical protein
MRVTDLWGLLGAIVIVALATTIVSSDNSRGIIKAFGDSFTGALAAAQGK